MKIADRTWESVRFKPCFQIKFRHRVFLARCLDARPAEKVFKAFALLGVTEREDALDSFAHVDAAVLCLLLRDLGRELDHQFVSRHFAVPIDCHF